MSELNKANIKRAIEEGWNQGKLDVFDELYAANFVLTDPQVPGGKLSGPAAYKQRAQMYLAAFPDLHLTVNDLIAEGDKLVGRWTATGTHKGELMGIAPTGKRVTATGITISRFENGKVVESWENGDSLGLLQQLGAVPTLAPANT